MFGTMRRTCRIQAISLISVTALATLLAGCSTGSSAAGSSHEYNIGVFLPSNDNAYLQAEATAAQDSAKKLGVKVTIVTSSWDSQAQNAAFNLAAQRKTYDAWIVTAVSPANQCNTILDAAKTGIPIVMAATAICGDNGYSKGTLAFVGEQNLTSYGKWFAHIKTNTPGGQVSVITGPALDYASQTATKAGQDAFATKGDVSLSTIQNTDYLAETAYKASQTFLQSNSHLTAIASIFSGMTRGVVEAVKQAGRNVLVYDSNGDSWTKEQIKAGTIKAALPGTPATDVKLAMQAVVDHLQGKNVETTIDPLKELTFTGAPIITSANVDSWNPEY